MFSFNLNTAAQSLGSVAELRTVVAVNSINTGAITPGKIPMFG